MCVCVCLSPGQRNTLQFPSSENSRAKSSNWLEHVVVRPLWDIAVKFKGVVWESQYAQIWRYLRFLQRSWQSTQVFRNVTLCLRASEMSGTTSPSTRHYIPQHLNPSAHIFLQMRKFSTIQCFDNCWFRMEILLRTFCNVHRRPDIASNDECSLGLV